MLASKLIQCTFVLKRLHFTPQSLHAQTPDIRDGCKQEQQASNLGAIKVQSKWISSVKRQQQAATCITCDVAGGEVTWNLSSEGMPS
jgi:hypothetical protein